VEVFGASEKRNWLTHRSTIFVSVEKKVSLSDERLFPLRYLKKKKTKKKYDVSASQFFFFGLPFL
jgi:hypothetical protein